MRIAVIGGTGLIGAKVVNHLRDHGADVGVGSPRTGVNAYTGRGLDAFFERAEVVVDATNSNRPAFEYEQSHRFFETCTKNILSSATVTGVQHVLGLSMIGAAAIDSEFFRGKATQEGLLLNSGLPHSLLRSSMVFDVVPRLIDHAGTTHYVRLPPVRVQPVGADDLARHVARLAVGAPLNGAYEIAGPEVLFLDGLARKILAAARDTRTVLADYRALYLGAHLDTDSEVLLPTWTRTSATFDEWFDLAAPRIP